MKKEANITVVPRFLEDPGSSFFLFGPRGTGRSTWLETVLGQSLRLDLLDPGVERALSARPERLREIVEGARQPGVVVVDEVQRAPGVLTVRS